MANTIAQELGKDSISLEDKLKLIDDLMNSDEAKKQFNIDNGRAANAPVDPMDVLQCEGCQ